MKRIRQRDTAREPFAPPLLSRDSGLYPRFRPDLSCRPVIMSTRRLTSMGRAYSFWKLLDADLIADAIYQGGNSRNSGSDPLARLLPVGNQGGFRTAGGRSLPACRLVAIFSNLSEPSWPDALDVETGRFTYYGDNRRPGHQLHDTPLCGNSLLR